MKTILATFALLTVIPIPVRWLDPRQDYSKCAGLFPFVGLVIGGLLALSTWGFTLLLPRLPAAVLVVGAMTAVSGALHLDGLADTADGFLSGRPRDDVLKIMHDSRVGAMGVVVVVLLLMLKVSLVSELLRWPLGESLSAVALSALSGRCSLVWSMRLNAYAREDGLGRSFWHRSWPISLLALAALLAASLWLAGMRDLIGVAAVLCVTLLFAAWCRRRIGGATGDTAGAGCELAETCFFLGVVSAAHLGVST